MSSIYLPTVLIRRGFAFITEITPTQSVWRNPCTTSDAFSLLILRYSLTEFTITFDQHFREFVVSQDIQFCQLFAVFFDEVIDTSGHQFRHFSHNSREFVIKGNL